MPAIQRKLAAILAADVHQFSKLMGEDEDGTLATLRACRQIVDGIIADHNGRIFGSAGDSVVAEFASAVAAVLCAVECQRAIANRNIQAGVKPLQFRMGVNIGDVIVEGDNLYGDGVNVAARLEAVARPGSICVSAKVYDEVRRKLSDISFVDGGAQRLKNIEDPIAVYHVGLSGEAAAPPASVATDVTSEKPMVAVQPLRVIAGDDGVRALAEGLSDAVRGAVARSSALAVKAGDGAGADYVLKGSVQGAGKRVRLSYALEDSTARQIWTDRYDRELSDVFELEDEIVLRVTAAIRVSVKAQIFEKLRHADNSSLSVPQLLNKGAGLFMRSLDRGGEAVPTLRLAVERAPENSMAWAMLGFALFRAADYHATAIPAATVSEITAALDRSIALDPRSYFARSIKSVTLHDLQGDVASARDMANEALSRNANFIPAKAMIAISSIHLGDVESGVRLLQETIAASPEDASDLRHLRELAIGHYLAGNPAEGVKVAGKLCQDHPEMMRNLVVLAGVSAAAGDHDSARRQIASLRELVPGLSIETARLPRFGNSAAGAAFRQMLCDSGL